MADNFRLKTKSAVFTGQKSPLISTIKRSLQLPLAVLR